MKFKVAMSRLRVSNHAMAVVVLAKFSSLPEAVVAKSLLEAEGIGVVMPEQGLVAGQLDAGVMEVLPLPAPAGTGVI